MDKMECLKDEMTDRYRDYMKECSLDELKEKLDWLNFKLKKQRPLVTFPLTKSSIMIVQAIKTMNFKIRLNREDIESP